MQLTVANLGEVPADLAPGTYCCRLESATWQELKVRFVPGSQHQPGDCLVQLTKEEPACRVCRDTGMVQCAEQDGSGVYEQACPEKVHDGQPCPACGGKGYAEGPGCTCGVGPSGYYGMHERYCGVEPCPRGCAFVAPGAGQ